MAAKILFLVLAAFTVGSVFCSPFEATVTTLDRYELGQDIICNVRITNTHRIDYRLFTRNTPLEGFKSRMFTIIRDGKRLRYDALMFKRGSMEKNSDNIVLPAEKSISIEVDLSLAYSLNTPDTYSVILSTDVFYLNEKGNISRQHLNSLPAEFDVVDTGNLPKQTIAEKIRLDQTAKKHRSPSKGNLIMPLTTKDPVYDGQGDDVDKDTAKTVWEAAYQKVVSSPAIVDKDDSNYVRWFGKVEEGRKYTVKGLFERIKMSMENDVYTLYFSGQQCGRNDFAYTSFGEKTIYLCNSYFSAEDIFDYNSKMGTFIHELTHSVGDTEDYEYGVEDCEDLAIDKPLLAIENADNYEYFCETL